MTSLFRGEVNFQSFHAYLEIGGGEMPEHMHEHDHLFVVLQGWAKVFVRNGEEIEELRYAADEIPMVEISAARWHRIETSDDFRGACIFSRYGRHGELLSDPKCGGRIDVGTVTNG